MVFFVLWKCITKLADMNHDFFPLASLGLTQGQSSLVTPHLPLAKSFDYKLTQYLSARYTKVILHGVG